MKVSENSKADLYFKWFDHSIDFLWNYVHFFSNNNLEHTDEVLYILHLSRSKIAKVLKNSGTYDEATGDFLRTWFAKLRRPRAHPSQRSNALSWEDQFLLFSLLKNKMTVTNVSLLLRKNEATVRYDLFSVLVKQALLEENSVRIGSRDCVRFDLYFSDLLLNHAWTDPLGLVDRASLETHARNCQRCYQLSEKLRIAADQVKAHSLHSVPEDFRAHVHNEMGTRWKRLVGGEWLGGMPLWIKVPLQIVLVVACIALVLNAARITITPGKTENRWLQTLATWTDSIKVRVFGNHHNSEVIDDVNAPVTSLNSAPSNVVKVVDPVTSLSIILGDKNFNAKIDKIPAAPLLAPIVVPARAKLPTQVAAALPKTPPVVVAPLVSAPVVTAPIVETTKPVASAQTTKLFYRWGAYSKNIESDSEKVLVLLGKYSAIKSGDLALGANHLCGKYFHFAIPKPQFESLIKEMRELGLVAFSSGQAISDKTTPIEMNRIVFLLLPSPATDSQ